MLLPLRIASRYLRTRHSAAAINIISMVSLAGVAVATMAIVCVLSVFNGFSEIAERRLSTLDTDLSVAPAEGKVIIAADSLAEVIAAVDGVAAINPVVTEQGLAIMGERQMPVTLTGVTPAWARNAVSLDSMLIDAIDPILDQGAVLSVGAAVRLEAHPAMYPALGLYVPVREGRINPSNPLSAFRADTLAIAGVFRSDQAEYDNDMVIMPLDRLRDMLDYFDGEASRLDITLDRGADIDDVADRIAAIDASLVVTDRHERHEAARRMIMIEKWVSFVMLAFILLIASFNVISTLSMMIIRKRESMSILSAMGATSGFRSSIFAWQGLLISLIGGIIGIILGSALTLAQQWGGFIKLGGDHSRMTITTYPVALEPSDLLAVMDIILVVGLIVAAVAAAMARDRR